MVEVESCISYTPKVTSTSLDTVADRCVANTGNTDNDSCDNDRNTDDTTKNTSSTTTTTTNNSTVPDEFICPLTLDIMNDPVVTRYGNSFERISLLNWVTKSKTCPLTRQSLRLGDIITNHRLKLTITIWKQQNNYKKQHQNHQEQNNNSNDMSLQQQQQSSRSVQNIMGIISLRCYDSDDNSSTDRSVDDPIVIMELNDATDYLRRRIQYQQQLQLQQSSSSSNTIRRRQRRHSSSRTNTTSSRTSTNSPSTSLSRRLLRTVFGTRPFLSSTTASTESAR